MPSAFTGNLRLTSIDVDCRFWVLEEPLRYEVGRLGSGSYIIVPAGFATDGASVPRVLQAVLPAWGKWSRAAIIHDYLYGAIDLGDPVAIAVPLPGQEHVGYGQRIMSVWISSRRHADAIFYEAMIVSGVSRPIAWLMWAAVRVAGTFR